MQLNTHTRGHRADYEGSWWERISKCLKQVNDSRQDEVELANLHGWDQAIKRSSPGDLGKRSLDLRRLREPMKGTVVYEGM